MEKEQIVFFICFVSILLILLVGFLLFILFWQRRKSNKFIREREIMQSFFNEELLKAQLEIQEDSFNHVSMEIHDNVGQTLSLLKVQLNIIEQKETFEGELVAEAKENVTRVMSDLRDIAYSINSDRINSSSLAAVTANELQRMEQTGIIRVSFVTRGNEQAIEVKKKLILFRMMQECFQNIIKHSRASAVVVCFKYEEHHLEIEITDNGIGFVQQQSQIGLGLNNLMTRVGVIGGEAKIISALNEGTTVLITAPYV
jgi:signal transduction histidine kinase